jgi:3-oxoacyl-[acyl-carrier protein] reductase
MTKEGSAISAPKALGLLRGRTAIVTGAGAIGHAIIGTLAQEGAAVEVWERSAEALNSLHTKASFCQLIDISSPRQVATAARQARRRWSSAEILVNTAAIATFNAVEHMNVAVWRKTIDVNLTGVFLTCRAFIRSLASDHGASIINIASIGGLRGEPEFAHYCAAKFGVIGLTQSLASEVGHRGIRVNCIAPGAIESPMNTATMARDARRAGASLDEVHERLRGRIPLRRLGYPEDVAQAALYLASDLARYVTGITLPVTGGIT